MKYKGLIGPIFLVMILYPLLSFSAGKPLGVPDPETIPYPDDEPPTAEMIQLGKMLFFDNRLTENEMQSCATCHLPELGFSDGVAKGINHQGKRQKLNSPGLCNIAWTPENNYHWVGRTKSLEHQAFKSSRKRGADKHMFTKLNKIPYYQAAFKSLFPEKGMTLENFGIAVAAFERSIICNKSPFDHYIQGETTALTPAAIRGMQIFQEKGNCTVCHGGVNFTDYSYRNIGIGKEEGRMQVTKNEEDRGKFKTPGLRNVLLTMPYMHDGSLGTLEDVVRHYNAGGVVNGKRLKGVDPLIQPLNLSEREILDLIAFLSALTEPETIKRPQIP